MLENIKAVLFDLDGTLVDSMWVWRQIDIDYSKLKGIDMPDGLQREVEGMSMLETAAFYKKKMGISDDIETMMHTWNNMAKEMYSSRVPYKKGAEDFLKYLKANKIKTGIATSNSRELLQVVTESLGLHRYIDCFMTANEVAHGKPSPDVYIEVAKRLGVEPKECLVFEDVLPGIMAGQAAGMRVCAVYDVYSAYVTEEKKNLADYYINDYTEILPSNS